MKVVQFSEVAGTSYNKESVKNVTGRVVIGKADGALNFCMRVFTIKEGGFTPRHAHVWEHEIFIHSGKGLLLRDGQWLEVQAGNAIFIPGNEEHQFKNMGIEDFVFVCLIPSGVAEL